MRGVWVGHWLHCPPESQFVGDRRVILKKLCFGPGEVQSWFAAEDGSVWYEHQFLEGIQEGERFLEPVSREELRRLLNNEISLCRRLHAQALIPLFQRELDRL